MLCYSLLELLHLTILRGAEFISKIYQFAATNAEAFLKISHICKQFVNLASITKNFTQDIATYR